MKRVLMKVAMCGIVSSVLLTGCSSSKKVDSSHVNNDPTIDNITMPDNPDAKIVNMIVKSRDEMAKFLGVEDDGEESRIEVDSTINGYDCTMRYYFDEEGEIESIDYSFFKNADEDHDKKYQDLLTYFDELYGITRSIDKDDYVSYDYDYKGDKLIITIVDQYFIMGTIYIQK